ncbi:hypothetical protein [Xanthobacter agilis]|jgi:hypothetical protein|uniref:Uncharacterized protein n=1 Tax=Xanthobacter agilis TaxID=47492 RepID=A0ABU0LCD5_XANAG|nr:hypothetical protein [Xanthobacter agilis]MDQ0504788.1 hypothetical protein [Xanthobacter agilis]
MATFKLPLSGDVTQFFRLFSTNLAALGSQIGLININLGQSKAPEVEQEVLENVASYGTQIGRISDALVVLLTHFRPERELDADELRALDRLRAMLDDIADIKERHRRRALRIPDKLDFGRWGRS